MNEPVSVRIGDVLASKYRVERILGAGGMGLVVAAEHVTLHHKVALKLMLPSAAGDAEAVQRFLREARAAAQLRSEHVARVLDVGTLESGGPFMVMELLDGSDLEAILRDRGPLPVHEAVDFVRQACDAVAEAHERGIVHRDLKPGNLFLAKDARGRSHIKVLDFGISKHTSGAITDLALTKTAAVMGSPFYMSPEQMRATRNVDARTDVWSLGVTLYQLLAGRVPFFTESPMELGAKVLHEDPEPLDRARADVSPAIAAVVKRCLEKDPAHRFASARDLSAALEKALTSSIPPSTTTRVLVTTGSHGEDASALPFSQTSMATGHTAMPSRRPPRRSLLFVGVAIAAAAAIAIAIRARPERDAVIAAPFDVVAAPSIEPAPLPAPTARATPDSAPPLASTAPPAPPAPVVSVAALPRSRPPTHHGNKSTDAGAPPPSPPAQPSATTTSNPLDHL